MPLHKNNMFYGLRTRMNDEQEEYVNSIIDYSVVFTNSVAGTGKTTMAVATMYYLVEKGVIDHVYYIFSPVEEKQLGFRPGTTQEKIADYIGPLYDALAEINQMPEKALDPKQGWIDAKPHTFMRGVNMKRVGVILEEAQNFTTPELRKTLSRIHDDCKVVVIGHEGQIDLPNPKQSGFVQCIEHFKPLTDIVRVCTLTTNYRGIISQHADRLQ